MTSADSQRRLSIRDALPTCATLLLAGLPVTLLLSWVVLDAPTPQRTWIQQVLIPLVSLMLVACLGIHYHRRWRRPMRQLRALLGEVRAGKQPIERLREVDGGMAPLVPQLQDLLRELRLQKQAHAELNEEMSLRVAQRTSAMERMISALKVQATIDPLTGLYNRRWLDKQLKSLMEQCRRDKLEVCALMIDVDHFKLLNDTLGHRQGDQLLRSLGQLIRCTMRGADAAFRYGGDEFLVLMPGSNLDSARALARRLETLVQSLTQPLAVNPKPRLSIGVGCLTDLGTHAAEQLIQLADRNLYSVKQSRPSKPHPPAAA